MAQEARFECLRCGSELALPYTRGVTEERTCPSCASNSVRHVKWMCPLSTLPPTTPQPLSTHELIHHREQDGVDSRARLH